MLTYILACIFCVEIDFFCVHIVHYTPSCKFLMSNSTNKSLMLKEVSIGADLYVSLLGKAKGAVLTQDFLQQFRKVFIDSVTNHYLDHWFPESPIKGSGFRCIRNNGRLDPLVRQMVAVIGVNCDFMYSLLPVGLTMWIDPDEVSVRYGESGSISVIYTADRPPTPPSPLATPPSKKIRPISEPPSTPVKMSPSTVYHHQQLVTPPHVYHHHHHQQQHHQQVISPSNNVNRRLNSSPPALLHHHPQMYNVAFLKDNSCKDIFRGNHMMQPYQELFVSS